MDTYLVVNMVTLVQLYCCVCPNTVKYSTLYKGTVHTGPGQQTKVFNLKNMRDFTDVPVPDHDGGRPK